jgi:hypothetical protein
MIQSPSSRRAYPPHLSRVREGFTTWLKSVNEAWTSDGAVGDAPAQQAEEANAGHGGGRLQSGATVGIFAILVFYFLYFASPILIPIITALLLSMLLAPFVRLLEWVRVPRTLGSLIVVMAAVGMLFGIAAGLKGPAQSWLTQPLQFSRLEEKLHPMTASLQEIQNAIGRFEKAMAPSDGPALQKVEVTPPGLAGLLSTGIGHVASTIGAIIGLLYFFLVSGDTFLRKLVLVTPSLKDKKRAVQIVRNIEMDISFLSDDGCRDQYIDRYYGGRNDSNSRHSGSIVVGYACCGIELCAVRWRVCNRHPIVISRHSDLR